MFHARGDSRVLAFLVAYSVVAFALCAMVAIVSPMLGQLLGGG